MTIFDYVVLTIIGLSILLSVMRGLVQEVLALAAWALAFWLASSYAPDVSRWMPASLPSDSLRYLAAFLAVFCATWLLSAILRITLNQFLKATGLKPLDRLLGSLFGLCRGFLLVLTLVLLAGLTNLPQTPMWRTAMFSPMFEAAAEHVRPWLPRVLAEKIRYEEVHQLGDK